MEYQGTSLLGSEEMGITFTDKAVTPWGGLVLFSGLANQAGLRRGDLIAGPETLRPEDLFPGSGL